MSRVARDIRASTLVIMKRGEQCRQPALITSQEGLSALHGWTRKTQPMEKRTLATPGSCGTASALGGGMRCLLRHERGEGIRNRGVFVSHEMYVQEMKRENFGGQNMTKGRKKAHNNPWI